MRVMHYKEYLEQAWFEACRKWEIRREDSMLGSELKERKLRRWDLIK
jgi:hypothetical protein